MKKYVDAKEFSESEIAKSNSQLRDLMYVRNNIVQFDASLYINSKLNQLDKKALERIDLLDTYIDDFGDYMYKELKTPPKKPNAVNFTVLKDVRIGKKNLNLSELLKVRLWLQQIWIICTAINVILTEANTHVHLGLGRVIENGF